MTQLVHDHVLQEAFRKFGAESFRKEYFAEKKREEEKWKALVANISSDHLEYRFPETCFASCLGT